MFLFIIFIYIFCSTIRSTVDEAHDLILKLTYSRRRNQYFQNYWNDLHKSIFTFGRHGNIVTERNRISTVSYFRSELSFIYFICKNTSCNSL